MATLPAYVTRVVTWLRAGYPEGVPQQDYLPLFALLGSHLTNDEVTLIADDLMYSADPGSADAIKQAIGNVTHSEVRDSDINRVRAHLAAGGWPLAIPPREE